MHGKGIVGVLGWENRLRRLHSHVIEPEGPHRCSFVQ